MFIRKDMHPARKALRLFLLMGLFLSCAFMSVIVGLRVEYRDHKPIKGEMQARVFQFDIFQHRARAYLSNDEGDLVIAEELLRAGIFSPLYTQAGLVLLEEKSAAGYLPAQQRLKEIFPNR